MAKISLNKLHRYVGIAISPFILIQTLSGLFLDFGFFGIADKLQSGEAPQAQGLLDELLMKIHFGGGWLGDLYHLLLGIGILWMILSGWILFLRLRRGRNKRR